MSTREQLALLHELESHGVVVICADDSELEEAISYEMADGDDGREGWQV